MSKKELVQTKGSVKFLGQVVGLQNENTYRSGVTKNGEGVPYLTASLTVKTSSNNVVYNLEHFGQIIEGKKVKVYSNKGGEKQTLEIDFNDRKNLPEGFTPFGFGTLRTSFEKDAKGKPIQKNYFSYDGVEVVKDMLKDGESVWVNGEFNPNTYMSNGEQKTSVKYTMNSIGYLKEDVDFESEKFIETSSFEQEMVVIDVNVDKETKKAYVTGRLIRYNKSYDDIVFVVDGNDQQEFAKNFISKVKPFDLIKTEGRIINGTVLEEVEPEKVAIDWGGETQETFARKNFTKNRIQEFRITNVTVHTPKFYKEDDFEVSQDPFNDNTDKSEENDGDPFK